MEKQGHKAALPAELIREAERGLLAFEQLITRHPGIISETRKNASDIQAFSEMSTATSKMQEATGETIKRKTRRKRR